MNTTTETRAFTLAHLHSDPSLLPIRTDIRWRDYYGNWQHGRLLVVEITSLGEFRIVYNHRSDHSKRTSDYLPGDHIVHVVTQELRQTKHEVTGQYLLDNFAFEAGWPRRQIGPEVEVTDIHGKRHRGQVQEAWWRGPVVILDYWTGTGGGSRWARIMPDSIVTVFEEVA